MVELEESLWDHMLGLNLKTAFLCRKPALKYMRGEAHPARDLLRVAERDAAQPVFAMGHEAVLL